MTATRLSVRPRFAVHMVILAAALIFSATALALVAARGGEPPRTVQDRVRAVASTLRCPVCQNLSVADSPSPLARQMRTTIARELQTGRTPDQIRARFVQSYGEWILLAPPARGLNLVAWVAPALLLIVGTFVAAVAVRRWTGQRPNRRTTSPSSPSKAFASADAPGASSGNGMRLSPDDRTLLERALSTLPEEPA